MESSREVFIVESRLISAAQRGVDAFLEEIVGAIKETVGGELNDVALKHLNGEQITLWGYYVLREELMDGGFVQLIYNGYGLFFFDNPFAKAMRLWGLKDFSKLLYKAKSFYDKYKDELTKPCSDDDFMGLFERFPEFDDLDDSFIEDEEYITDCIAHYVDEHIDQFVTVKTV